MEEFSPLFDAHFHIIEEDFPLIPNNGYLPPFYSLIDYLKETGAVFGFDDEASKVQFQNKFDYEGASTSTSTSGERKRNASSEKKDLKQLPLGYVKSGALVSGSFQGYDQSYLKYALQR